MNKQEGKHDRDITALSIRPTKIGLQDIVIAAKEVNIFNTDGTLRRQPDLVFIDKYGVVSIAEYQINRTHKERAYHQLEDSTHALQDAFGITPKTLYIHHGTHVEEYEIK